MTLSKNKSGNKKSEGLAVPVASNLHADSGFPSAEGQQISLRLLMLVWQVSIFVIYYKGKCGRNGLTVYIFPPSLVINSWFLGAIINGLRPSGVKTMFPSSPCSATKQLGSGQWHGSITVTFRNCSWREETGNLSLSLSFLFLAGDKLLNWAPWSGKTRKV